MWHCPLCGRPFKKTNQAHSCLDKTTDAFLAGKQVYTIELLYHFIDAYKTLGEVTVRATKSMLVVSGQKPMAYIIQAGKNFIDIVFPFPGAHTDNLCFRKIRQVPGSRQYNHHFRMLYHEDLNEELRSYMKLALEQAAD